MRANRLHLLMVTVSAILIVHMKMMTNAPPDAPPDADEPLLIRGGAAHLKHMQWAKPGYMINAVGADSPLRLSVYNLNTPAPAECKSTIHEERSASVKWPLAGFLEHLGSDAQQSTHRMYVEDTYLYSSDPDYLHLARNKGSAALHGLDPDLPSTVPAFAGAAAHAGRPLTAVAFFMGNGSDSSMHQDAGECNFITQIHGCKEVITAPPEAVSVLGRNPLRTNDALLETSRRSSWSGLPARGSAGLADGLSLCGGTVPVPGARYFRLCAGDVLYLPTSTWHALYGDVVPAGGPPSMTVTFFFESASVAATSTT